MSFIISLDFVENCDLADLITNYHQLPIWARGVWGYWRYTERQTVQRVKEYCILNHIFHTLNSITFAVD